ncbi:MAG: carbamoyltransferase HypF [Actinobacteria bacterium]|nr:carbamoyltransferase HypF [Actinomycetota bacterium]
MGSTEERIRRGVRIDGTVQGVGFRPYVYALATELGLTGHVGNDAAGVFIEIEGREPAIERFLTRLPVELPPLARIERFDVEPLTPVGTHTFTIVASDAGGVRTAQISPDVATCDDCLAEVTDRRDRRHRYPFTNCTNCGPRLTIVTGVPYDRPNTTMARFDMCEACAAEYADPRDRRFHAQPVCCPACGPSLRLVASSGEVLRGDPIEQTARLLLDGRVVAVKGVGGYHLAVDATSEEATAALRRRKHREEKPFALMVADLATARELCEVGETEAELLTGRERPILLLPRRQDAAIASSVAPRNRSLGLMLPYTPLHHLLLVAVDRPLVLTSGNVSDEPIAFRDDDAFERLGPIADAFLTHERPIHTRVDDSVVRVIGDRVTPLRRSRGYAPRPVEVAWPFPRHVLAVGAELKNTFALAKDQHVFVSHHIGDLENHETLRAFTDGIAHFARLFDISPEVVAHDLHPEYLSTKYASELDDVELVGVQHHHAHIVSCLADNAVDGPVIGFAFDGTGYGDDGTIWGGEVLVADRAEHDRVGHLSTVPLAGGAAAIREPWRMAATHLDAAGLASEALEVRRRNAERWDDVVAVGRSGINSPPTSSVGRLFDAVAALVGIRDAVTYEGQAAIELEQAADVTVDAAYPATLDTSGAPFTIAASDLIRAVVDDLRDGVPAPTIAARFHAGLIGVVVEAAEHVRGVTGLTTVALSGGVFQNVRLVEGVLAALTQAGFEVLTHRRVPPNDGGISLGQAVIAAAVSSRSTW